MDKQKAQLGPRPRTKRVLPPPGDFIALGKSSSAKPRSISENDPKTPQGLSRKPSTSSLSSGTQKRKDMNPGNPSAPKQPRTFSPSFLRGKDGSSKCLEQSEPMPTVKLVDAQPSELEELVLTAISKGDQDQVDGLLCCAIKTLKINRLKPDQMLYLTLINLAKEKPNLFASKKVLEHLLQFLRRDTSGSVVKPKPNTLLCILTCSILLHAYQNEENWPHSFMKVYVEDSLGDRSWVDNEHNKEFVSNIACVFGTKLPSNISSLAPMSLKPDSVGGPLNSSAMKLKEAKIPEEISLEATEPSGVQNRFPMQKDEVIIQTYIQEVLKEQLNKRQMIDSVSRNVLRFLTAVCGYAEVRSLASLRLEAWLQNPKLTRPAQELLMSICLNCNTHSTEDVDVIANLVRMRLKAKPVANHYVNCIKELLSQHANNLGTTLKHVIYNELSQQRNPHNMAILSVIFVHDPEAAAKYLAIVFQDLLCGREDYLRALRALFREVVRSLKYEVNLVEFCRGMMQDRHETVFSDLEQQYKDRMFASVIDLICLGCFLSVSPIVKELSLSLSKGEKRDYSVLQAFQSQISVIQNDAIWFFHMNVISMYRCSEKEFGVMLNRVLFLESNDQYSNKDNWPPETERNILLQLVREVPLAEDALLRLHCLGLDDDILINRHDTLDITEKMILRAAVLRTGLHGLEVERVDVLELLLKLSAYTHPKDITLPSGYLPPSLAISALYWKTWLVMLVLAATNPATIGLNVWETYPTAKCMMEMLITGCYQFPPLGFGSTVDEIRANELQICRAEKDDIIVFEGHLAAATSGQMISESTSLLISQLITLKPTGPPRSPPPHVIEKLKTLNETYALGKMLCRSREPDFLLSIIQSQGSSRSMPWLADLVQSSESSLNALPIQCLCEFLLMKENFKGADQTKQKSIKYKVVARLQDLLMGKEATAESSIKLVKYFIQRWPSLEMKDREASVSAFQSILLLQRKRRSSGVDLEAMECEDEKAEKKGNKMETSKDDAYSWLHEKMRNLQYFDDFVADVMLAIRQSLTVEVDIQRLQAYIQFISSYYGNQSKDFVHVLVENISQLITCRRTVAKNMIDRNTPSGLMTYNSLLNIFATYIKSELRDADTGLSERDRVSKVKVTWSGDSLHSEKYVIVHLKVAHACIVLLTFSCSLEDIESYDFLLRTWFIEKGSYNVVDSDLGCAVELFEEWLRVMLIQSNHKQLALAGLKGCSPTQQIRFLQASGIPAENLSLLLAQLDKTSESKSEELLNLIIDTDHFIQLVELSQSRGAVGGEKFCTLLQADYQKEADALTVEEISNDLVSAKITEEKPERVYPSIPSFSNDSMKNTLVQLFCEDEKSARKNFLQLKGKLSLCVISQKQEDLELANSLIEVLIELSGSIKFLEKFCASKREAVTLLQVLSRVNHLVGFKELVDHLKDCKGKSNEMEKVIDLVCQKFGIEKSPSKAKTNAKKLVDSLLAAKSPNRELPRILEGLISALREADIKELEKLKLVQVCLLVLQNSKNNFEWLIKVLCGGAKSAESVKYLVEVLVLVLSSVDDKFSGLLIDSLTSLDPEILSVNAAVQRQFLFSKRNSATTSGASSEKSSTAFMTSVLAHQTSNSTLENCFSWILDHSRDTESLKSSTCLDFLTAIMNNPRLWQGRENKQDTEKEKQEDSYGNEGHIEIDLSIRQIYSLVKLILSELDQIMKDTDADAGAAQSSSITDLMNRRLSLLLSLTSKNSRYLPKAIKLVKQSNKFRNEVFSCFLRHLYARQPIVIPDITKMCDMDERKSLIPEGMKTPMDRLIHRLILSISEMDGTKEWETKFKCVSSVSRRLAVKHPHAYLRHLPLLLSMLKGKSRLPSSVFKLTNQLLFCTHVFGLFDLLRPHVFHENKQSEYTISMFVEVFMELIQSSCLKADECAGFVNKLVEFLNHFISSANPCVGRILKKYELVFRDLMFDFPNFEGLTFITTFINAYDEKSDVQLSLLASHTTPFNEVQLLSFKQRLTADHHYKDLLNVLGDLDETSKRRIDILEHFLTELSALTLSTDEEIRDKSHMLLLRHHKYQPRNSYELVELYLKRLDSDIPDIILTTAKYAPQVLLLSDRKCDILLKRMYDIAISKHTQVSTFIAESMKNLNIDYV